MVFSLLDNAVDSLKCTYISSEKLEGIEDEAIFEATE